MGYSLAPRSGDIPLSLKSARGSLIFLRAPTMLQSVAFVTLLILSYAKGQSLSSDPSEPCTNMLLIIPTVVPLEGTLSSSDAGRQAPEVRPQAVAGLSPGLRLSLCFHHRIWPHLFIVGCDFSVCFHFFSWRVFCFAHLSSPRHPSHTRVTIIISAKLFCLCKPPSRATEICQW